MTKGSSTLLAGPISLTITTESTRMIGNNDSDGDRGKKLCNFHVWHMSFPSIEYLFHFVPCRDCHTSQTGGVSTRSVLNIVYWCFWFQRVF